MKNLSKRPKYDRLSFGTSAADSRTKVDVDGGDNKAGLIEGVAIITRGPALGHRAFVDAVALQQVADFLNAKGPKGLKSRFTHPSMSGDGTGKFLGRAKKASVDGDSVRADLHFSKTAHKTPDGDLAGWVMGLADEDPESFGLSIVFEHDVEAENEFVEANGGKVLDPVYGYYDLSGFKSPDPKNANGDYHFRVKALHAVDVVDEPAANANGLFRRGQEVPTEADALCAYAFGLTDERPVSSSLGIDPDRLRGFASRFLSAHRLTLTQEAQVADNTEELSAPVADEVAVEATTEELSTAVAVEEEVAADEVVAESQEQEAEAVEAEAVNDEAQADEVEAPEAVEVSEPEAVADPAAEFRAELSRFIELDAVDGPKWLAEGKSYDEAKDAALAKLKSENAKLAGKLSAGPRGEATPVSFSAEPSEGPATRNGLPSGIARFAAAIRLPGSN